MPRENSHSRKPPRASTSAKRNVKPVAKSRRVAAFRSRVRTRLGELTARLRAVLARLITHPYPDEFWQLDFEIHDDHDVEVVLRFYREDFNEVGPSDRTEKLYPMNLRRRVQAATLVKLSGFIKEAQVNPDEYWFSEEACREVVRWFQKCWLAAGGRGFKHRARLGGHDSDKRLDLVRGRWTKDG